jgi:hypothetical protein
MDSFGDAIIITLDRLVLTTAAVDQCISERNITDANVTETLRRFQEFLKAAIVAEKDVVIEI